MLHSSLHFSPNIKSNHLKTLFFHFSLLIVFEDYAEAKTEAKNQETFTTFITMRGFTAILYCIPTPMSYRHKSRTISQDSFIGTEFSLERISLGSLHFVLKTMSVQN